MAIKTKDGYKCAYCGRKFTRAYDADIHRDNEHDIIYLPISREDLNRLMNFIYSGNQELLTPSLLNTIKHTVRNLSVKQSQELNNDLPRL